MVQILCDLAHECAEARRPDQVLRRVEPATRIGRRPARGASSVPRTVSGDVEILVELLDLRLQHGGLLQHFSCRLEHLCRCDAGFRGRLDQLGRPDPRTTFRNTEYSLDRFFLGTSCHSPLRFIGSNILCCITENWKIQSLPVGSVNEPSTVCCRYAEVRP